MTHHRNGHGNRRNQVVGDVKAHSGRSEARAASAGKEQVERPVEQEDHRERGRGDDRSPSCESGDQCDARECAGAVAPAEIERCGSWAPLEQKSRPGNASPRQICVNHAAEVPALEVPPAYGRVKPDRPTHGYKPHAEFDVFHTRVGKPALVEASSLEERVTPNRSETGPKGRGRSGGRVVNVMVKEVTEVRNDPAGLRIIVIRSEDRAELGVAIEGSTNPSERVGMHLDIRVEEDEDVAARPACPFVTCGGRPHCCRPIDKDDLLRSVECVAKRGKAPLQGLPSIRGRYHHRNRMHRLILSCETLRSRLRYTVPRGYNPTRMGGG